MAFIVGCVFSIGFSIAQRLAKEGAKVVISSRRKEKVDKAVETLKNEKAECHGLVCHVGKPEDRQRLVEEVSFFFYTVFILFCF